MCVKRTCLHDMLTFTEQRLLKYMYKKSLQPVHKSHLVQ